MAAFTASQASVTNGSKVVTINSGESTANIRKGDFLVLGTFSPVEILRGYVSTGGVQSLELIKAWDSGNQSNQKAIVIPTTVEVRTAVTALQNANTLVNDNFAAMQDWQTKTGTVTFTNQDGTTSTIKTLKQMENEANAQLAEYHPYPWAMRKVEFEALRSANNEKYAASGFVHKGKARSSASGGIAGDGLYSYIAAPVNTLRLGCSSEVSDAFGKSKKSTSVISIAGVDTLLDSMSTAFSGYCFIKLPPAEDGTRTYDSATGIPVTHATPAIAFASETATNKVVTDRVDTWGFEAFLREINDADPFVYDYGLIQSRATSINGVSTVDDNVRPITYFAWYGGDTTSRGKGVNWQTATEAQRIAIASDPSNNIYFDDATGKFYQWCIRGRSFAGLGNGDWSNTDASDPALNTGLQFNSTLSVVKPQGIKDAVNKSIASYTDDLIGDFLNYNNSFIQAEGFKSSRGTFAVRAGTISNNNQYAVNGQCYFLVCGTVNRLNQGAYHPSLNPSGSRKWRDVKSGGPVLNASDEWQGIENTQCVPTKSSDAFNVQPTGVVPQPSASSTTGFIDGPAGSGRPDGRFYDAIYASGQGGVCRDMRYSAWGLTKEDFAEADLAIKSGEYRGRETLFKVCFKFATPFYFSNSNVGSNVYFRTEANNAGSLFDFETNGITRQASVIVYQPQTGYVGYGELHPSTGHIKLLGRKDNLLTKSSGSYTGNMTRLDRCYILEVEPVSSVAGEFTHTEVIGDPANILQCDALKDGWVGSWNSKIPDGLGVMDSPFTYPVSKSDSGTYSQIGNANNVLSSGAMGIDITKNINGGSLLNTLDRIAVCHYKTKTGITRNSANSEIYGGTEGIGGVFITQGYLEWAGVGLGYSLTGKVLDSTGDGNSLFFNNIPLEDFKIYNGKLGGWTSNEKANPTHTTTYNFGPPENSPVAFKALSYNVAENQQGFINYAYTELTHNGTDWGDDGKIHLVNNQTTMLDENGNTVLVGTAQIVEPLGWIKNDK